MTISGTTDEELPCEDVISVASSHGVVVATLERWSYL